MDSSHGPGPPVPRPWRRTRRVSSAGQHRGFGGDIDPAFVEDPLTGGTASARGGRGCVRIRKEKWYDRQLKGA